MRSATYAMAGLALLVLAPAASAVDLSGLLPRFTWPGPSLPRIEAPFHPAPAPAPAADESGGSPAAPEAEAEPVVPPSPQELDPTLQTGADAQALPPARKSSRSRGWRGLLPGSLK